jgi:NAD(P)-dependent dehydrogenase (short-subunit alcohol dehydrogenase family)
MRLQGKVTVVTGAGTGIGRAIAVEFVRQGAYVTVCNRSAITGEETVNLANAARKEECGKAIFVPTDVSKSEDVRRMIGETVSTFGGLDILVNNAGLSITKPIEELSEEEWDTVIDINLKGHFLCAKYAIPHLKARGSGVIINMSSVLGYVGLPNKAAYCSTKSAIIGLTRVMALELAPYNIRVNCLAPGSTDTPMMWQNLSADEIEAARREQELVHPVGYVAEPEQIARAALFFATREVDYMHGTVMLMDGGSLSKFPGPR